MQGWLTIKSLIGLHRIVIIIESILNLFFHLLAKRLKLSFDIKILDGVGLEMLWKMMTRG